MEYTVTYKADGEPISTETVGHGKDANLPSVPAKDGYVGKWDSDGKNITNDTTISVIYTEIPVVKPDEVKPEDKSDLEDAKEKLEEMLDDDSYTDDDKKDIQDAIDYVVQNENVDAENIFLLGLSGGGHMALLMAGKCPGYFKAIGAFVPITDLRAWITESQSYRKTATTSSASDCGIRIGQCSTVTSTAEWIK